VLTIATAVVILRDNGSGRMLLSLAGVGTMSTSNFEIGEWLRERRVRAALGLRQFAQLIGDSPSNVCNIENGKRPPWQNEPKLRRVAEVLGIKENSEDWDALFGKARRPDQPPADLARYMQFPYVPTLLRTIGEYQLNEEEIKKLLSYVKKTFGKGRKSTNAQPR
jgi:transcriptional regulator with XRE-family HTH domain